MRRLRNYILSAFAVVLCASGCQWRPLEDPEDTIEIKVAVEIKTVLNVNASVYNDLIPAPSIKTDMFRVMFYDPNNGKLVSQAFLSEPTTNKEGKSCLGGSVKIGVGTYDMLCYNFDTPDTYVSGENAIENIYAYTNGVSEAIKTRYQSKSDDNGVVIDEDIRYEPDHLLVAREMGLKINAHTGLLIIETEATTVVDSYYIQVRIEGAQFANSASAILSGMAPSNHFGLAQRDTDVPSSVYFELQKSIDKNIVGGNQDVLCCVFNTFGKIYHDENGKAVKAPVSSDSELVIDFNVIRTDGKIFEYKKNMNDIFNSEDAIERHWLLINDKIVVPDPGPGPTPSGGGGFQPQVGEWDNVNSDITL